MDLMNYLSAEEWQIAEAGNLDGTQIVNQFIAIGAIKLPYSKRILAYSQLPCPLLMKVLRI